MKTSTQPLTAEDLWNLPDDGQRHELVKGELITMPPAGFEHGAIGFDLALALGNHVKKNNLGKVVNADTGFLLEKDPDTVRAADIAFVRQERVESEGLPKKYWSGAPDLVVEVISPTDRVNAVDEKVDLWLEYGARMIWVVNPKKRNVTIYQPDNNPEILSENETLGGGQVVPGFQCQVRDIFP